MRYNVSFYNLTTDQQESFITSAPSKESARINTIAVYRACKQKIIGLVVTLIK